MFPRLFLAVAICAFPAAAERWIKIVSGPFEVFTNAGDRAAREPMYEAEQMRWALGELIGKKDLGSVWPIRIIVSKNPTSAPAGIAMGRDSYISFALADKPLSAAWREDCARILLEANTERLPAEVDKGLIALISTLQINSTKLTIGTPPAPDKRTRDWARLHMLVTTQEWVARLRIFISNLEKGADLDTAYRNTYEKKAVEMEKMLDAHLAVGATATAPYSGRALSDRDFTIRELETFDGRLPFADLMLAQPSKAKEAEAAYQAVKGSESQEGIGLLTRSKKAFEAAAQAGSKNARAWFGLDTKDGYTKAAELNPKWSEPHAKLANFEEDPGRRATELRKAARLEPRNAEYWKMFALALIKANQFIEAGKAWTAAEKASATPEDRAKMHQARLDIETQRADYEEGERKRAIEEREREMQRLKDAAMAEIRAAEAKANKAMQADGPVPTNVQKWEDVQGPPTQRITGVLQRVDCIRGGHTAKLVLLTEDKKTVLLVVRDPGQIALEGVKEATLGCGPQKPPRDVAVDYVPKPDAKLSSIGDVNTIVFK